MLLGIAISPLVADFFGQPSVAPLFAGTSVLFLLWALSSTQNALLMREMNFRGLEIRVIVAGIAGAAAAVSLGVAGAGAWAIVGQGLVQAGASLVLLWTFSPWRPKFMYSRESLRSLGSYSGKTLASQMLGYLVNNVDNLLVGRFLGSVALGLYSVAYNTMFLPVSRISTPLQQVLFSAFAKIQHEPKRLADAWARGNEVITAVNVPAFLGMAVVAPDFVPVVLGQKWTAAVPVLQWLSLAGVGTTLQTLNWCDHPGHGETRRNVALPPVLDPGHGARVRHRFALGRRGCRCVVRHLPVHHHAGPARTSPAERSEFRPSMCEAKPWSQVLRWSWQPLWPWRASGSCMSVCRPRLDSSSSSPLALLVYGGLLLLFAPRVIGELRMLAHRRA